MIGQPIALLFPPDRREELLGYLAALRQGHRVKRLQTAVRHRDGHMMLAAFSLSPLRNTSGAIVGSVGFARDETERQLTDQALRQSRDQLKSVTAHARCILWHAEVVLRPGRSCRRSA